MALNRNHLILQTVLHEHLILIWEGRAITTQCKHAFGAAKFNFEDHGHHVCVVVVGERKTTRHLQILTRARVPR